MKSSRQFQRNTIVNSLSQSDQGLSSSSSLPDNVCKHWPFVVSQTLTVESAFPDTRIFWRSSMPDVRLWWPIKVCLQVPEIASHTRIEVSSEPDTTCTPSNWNENENVTYSFYSAGLRCVAEHGSHGWFPYLQWIDTICMPLKCVQTFFCLWIPNLNHVIISTGNHKLSVILYTANSRQMTY